MRAVWIFAANAFAALLIATGLIFLPSGTAGAQSTVRLIEASGELKAPPPPMRAPAKSKLAFHIRIPKAPIIEALNRFDVYREIGKVTDCPQVLAVQVCNYSYDISFERDGAADIDFNQRTIVASIPLKITGEIAYRTKATEAATRNRIDGKFKLVLATKVSIENRWCVDVDSSASLIWESRPKLPGSKVLNAIVDSLRPLDTQIEQSVSSVVTKERLAAVKDALCSTIREQISRFWKPHVIQFPAKNLGVMYAHILPKSIKFSGPSYSGSELSVGVHLDVETHVSFQRKIIDIGELPPLVPVDSIREQILLDIPAFMTLQEIKSAAMQIASTNKFNLPLPIGGMEAELHNIEPNVTSDERGNTKLEFKVDYSVGFGWLPLRAWGVAQISGRPEVDSENGRILYSDVQTKLELTNGLFAYFFDWALPRAEQVLRLKIKDIGKADVKKELEASTQELRRQVAQLDTLTGFQLDLKDFHAVLDSLLAMESTGLILSARASGQFEARMRELSTLIWDTLQEYRGPFKRQYQIVNTNREQPVLRQRHAKGTRINMQVGRPITEDLGKFKLSDCRWFDNDVRYMWCRAELPGPQGKQTSGWIRQYHLAPST